MFAGQLAVGAWVPLMVTVNEQEELLFAASVAVTVTVDVPSGNVLPDAGLATETAEQLSFAAGRLKLTALSHIPVPTVWVMFVEH